MYNIIVYENKRFGNIRTFVEEGKQEPWFVAADVCRALEVKNARDAVARLDDDEKNTVVLTDGNRGNPNVTVVSEPGLYALVLSSRKPEAKEFKRWITHDVIPSIRKSGGYIAGQEDMSDADLMAKALIVAQRQIEQRDKQITEMQPKALFADAVSASKTSILFEENYLFCSGFFHKSVLQKKADSRIVDGNIIIQNGNAVAFRRGTQQIQCFAAIASSSVFRINHDVGYFLLHFGIIVIGNFANKLTIFVFEIPVIPLAIRVSNPAIVPATPFIFPKGNCPAPCVIVRHGIFIRQHHLPKPQILIFWLIQRQHIDLLMMTVFPDGKARKNPNPLPIGKSDSDSSCRAGSGT